MLTKDDIKILSAPLPRVTGHELRPSETMGGGKYATWLTYTEEGPVKERLDEVDPAWTFEIIKPGNPCYARLTVKGVTRDCVGTGGPGGDGEKGAATDALKRGARLFGIGLYLKNAPRIFTQYRDPKGLKGDAKREAYRYNDARKAEAKAQFLKWFDRQFPNMDRPDDHEPETVNLAGDIEDTPQETPAPPRNNGNSRPTPGQEGTNAKGPNPLEEAAKELARETFPFPDAALKVNWADYISKRAKWQNVFWPAVTNGLGYPADENNAAAHEALKVKSVKDVSGTVGQVWLTLALNSPKLAYLRDAQVSPAE